MSAGHTGAMSPSPRLWRMRRAEVAAAGVVLAGIVGTAAQLTAGPAAAGAAAAGVAACTVPALWFARNRFRSWAYQERDDDLIVERGVMVRRLSVVPYGRMQFVDVTAGPVDRIYRLATVRLHTAAAASDARIPGLEREEAARLRDRLAALGEAKAAGL
ncbi:MAG TPA: PH domain-containing protein [Streptosporangiaceae bacterium]|nr:PH domain-containing protein [Streptosporangiaceae bacterium]